MGPRQSCGRRQRIGVPARGARAAGPGVARACLRGALGCAGPPFPQGNRAGRRWKGRGGGGVWCNLRTTLCPDLRLPPGRHRPDAPPRRRPRPPAPLGPGGASHPSGVEAAPRTARTADSDRVTGSERHGGTGPAPCGPGRLSETIGPRLHPPPPCPPIRVGSSRASAQPMGPTRTTARPDSDDSAAWPADVVAGGARRRGVENGRPLDSEKGPSGMWGKEEVLGKVKTAEEKKHIPPVCP